MELKEISVGEWHFREKGNAEGHTLAFIKDLNNQLWGYFESFYTDENDLIQITENDYEYYNTIFKSWQAVNQ